MYDDVESDFWKELFVNVQHKNMVRAGAEKLEFSNCKNAFDDFKNRNPDLKISTDFSSSYCIFEVEITPTVKLRLFIQSSIKATLLQFDGGDYVKIADAKFPNNPFEEIEQLLQNKDKYEREIEGKIIKNTHVVKQQKITGEFIKALLMKKYSNSDFIWDIYPKDTENFTLIIKNKGNDFEKNISMKNFVSDIENLEI